MSNIKKVTMRKLRVKKKLHTIVKCDNKDNYYIYELFEEPKHGEEPQDEPLDIENEILPKIVRKRVFEEESEEPEPDIVTETFCEICQTAYANDKVYKIHLYNRHHKPGMLKTFCRFCNEIFLYKSEADAHYCEKDAEEAVFNLRYINKY